MFVWKVKAYQKDGSIRSWQHKDLLTVLQMVAGDGYQKLMVRRIIQ